MKICMITSTHVADDGRIFHREATTLARAGHDVTLIAVASEPYEQNGIQVVPIQHQTKRIMRFLFGWYGLCHQALEISADVYHIHDPDLIPAAMLIKRKTQARIIYDVHEDFPDYVLLKEWIPSIWKPLVRRFTIWLESCADHYFDGIITADDAVMQRFQEAPFREVIYNYPRLDLFKQTGVDFETCYDIILAGGIGDYLLNFVGQTARALNAIRPNHKWCLLGHLGPVGGKSSAERVLASYGVANNVEVVDRVPHECVYEYLKKSRLGAIILPDMAKFHRNIPTKLFEYFACQIPVVSIDLPTTRRFLEVIDERMLAPADNPDMFADAIDFMLSNPSIARSWANEGYDLVLREWNWGAMESRLLMIYEGIESNMKAAR